MVIEVGACFLRIAPQGTNIPKFIKYFGSSCFTAISFNIVTTLSFTTSLTSVVNTLINSDAAAQAGIAQWSEF